MTRITTFFLVVAALGLGACRSDGGIGRADSEHGLAWTLDVLGAQTDRDVQHTAENAARFTDWIGDEVSDPWDEMHRTWLLYSEGTAEFGEH